MLLHAIFLAVFGFSRAVCSIDCHFNARLRGDSCVEPEKQFIKKLHLEFAWRVIGRQENVDNLVRGRHFLSSGLKIVRTNE